MLAGFIATGSTSRSKGPWSWEFPRPEQGSLFRWFRVLLDDAVENGEPQASPLTHRLGRKKRIKIRALIGFTGAQFLYPLQAQQMPEWAEQSRKKYNHLKY